MRLYNNPFTVFMFLLASWIFCVSMLCKKGGVCLKKIVCIFMILTILLSGICVNAAGKYDCKPIIGLDPTKNVIDLEFTLDDNMPNDRFMIAIYIEGKLDKLYHYSFSYCQFFSSVKENRPFIM